MPASRYESHVVLVIASGTVMKLMLMLMLELMRMRMLMLMLILMLRLVATMRMLRAVAVTIVTVSSTVYLEHNGTKGDQEANTDTRQKHQASPLWIIWG